MTKPFKVLITGWREITRLVGRSDKTLRKWEKEHGFPISRPSGPGGAVQTTRGAVELWTLKNIELTGAKTAYRLTGKQVKIKKFNEKSLK